MISAEIRGAIEAVVKKCIRSVPIARIDIEEGTDWLGGDILRIRTVFDGKEPDGKEMLRLGRVVRERLLELNDERLPHTSYISKADASRASAA